MASRTRFNLLFAKHLEELQKRTGMNQGAIGSALGGNRFLCQNAKRNPKAISLDAVSKFAKLADLDDEQLEELRDAWFEERLELIKKWGGPFSHFIQECRAASKSDAQFLKAYRKLRDQMLDRLN